MATANQSQKLCLYSDASGQKYEVEAQADKCVIAYPKPVEFSGSVNIGALVDIETILDSLIADDATNAAAIVSQNTALSASIATVASNLTSEVASRTAADTAEATARTNGDAAHDDLHLTTTGGVRYITWYGTTTYLLTFIIPLQLHHHHVGGIT